ncbi:MAG: hypothetical protein WA858_21810 [Xanthobacteraceae bacterium]
MNHHTIKLSCHQTSPRRRTRITDPNRFRSLLGEARAANQTGDSATAHDAYRKLVALSKPVGPARPELAEARSYLTN